MINAPILHVNGDHPEGQYLSCGSNLQPAYHLFLDVVKAMDIAFKYRQYFRKVCLLRRARAQDRFESKANH